MMQAIFTELAARYCSNKRLIEQVWAEIEKSYSNPKRSYHTLFHLQQFYNELEATKDAIRNWDALLFSLFFHDLVYNPLRRDNEERSNIIAEDRMAILDVPPALIHACMALIMATKAHKWSEDGDTNIFTDADLSILGQPAAVYDAYTAGIRKEYILYSDILYKPGRKAVVQHFLSMDRIFKTDHFYSKYEHQAKENLQRELLSL
jgi:predicted metal-dependent HD superfamily phosphohydrolase